MVPGVSVSSAEADRPDPNEVLMFVNRMPRYEVLSPEAIALLEKGWQRIVSEVGVQFAKTEALDLFRQHGQKVEDEVVFFDPEFVLEQIARAPREFVIQARNPAHNVHIGGDEMAFSAVYGPRSYARGRYGATPLWTISAGSPCWPRVSLSSIRPAG